MQTKKIIKNNMIAMVLAGGMSALTMLNAAPTKAKNLTAGSVVEDFTATELSIYFSGMIDGFKYARYEKEGNSTEGGWSCIHNWFYDKNDTALLILTAFKKFKNHHPNAVMAALIKRECGD